MFREGLAGASDPTKTGSEIGEVLHRTIFGASEEAGRLRTEIFLDTLAQVAEHCPDKQIQSTAQHLYALLAPPAEQRQPRAVAARTEGT